MAQATKGRLNTLAMIVAFLAIGGFLWWLSMVSEPTEIVAVEESEVAQAVSLAAFARSPALYENVLIQVNGVEVQSLMGDQAFLLMLPDSTSYPVRLEASVVSAGVQLAPGTRGDVTGTVHMMTDSVLDAWVADSVLADEAEREMASEFGSFLLAREFEAAGMEMDGDSVQMDDGADQAGDGA